MPFRVSANIVARFESDIAQSSVATAENDDKNVALRHQAAKTSATAKLSRVRVTSGQSRLKSATSRFIIVSLQLMNQTSYA
jgi:hypothetical protein